MLHLLVALTRKKMQQMGNAMDNKLIKRLLAALPIVFILWVSYEYCESFEVKDLEPIVSLLQSISSMIFTIMGIWIAYIYPNAILKITQPSKVEAIYSEDDEKRVRIIVGTVILSASVLLLLLFGISLRTIILKTSIYRAHPFTFDFLSTFLLFNLVYIQMAAIYIVIASNVNFLVDLRNKKTRQN